MQSIELLLKQHANLAHTAVLCGRDALVHDNHSEWLLNEFQREFALWNANTLDKVLHRRQRLTQIAMERHHDALLQREQIDFLVERLRIEIELANRRGEQASLDDRYLSRTLWLAKQEARRVKSS
jgi:hypothetical protein